MATEILATVENGALTLDAALPFPDRTRVKLIVEPVEEENSRLVALERMLAAFDAKPIRDGKPFDRESLYERD